MSFVRKIILFIGILFVIGVFVQIFRVLNFSEFFQVKQEYIEEDYSPVSSKKITKKYSKILVINSLSDSGNSVFNNLKKTFDYSKINYDVINIEEINELRNEINKKKPSMVIIVTEKVDNFDEIGIFNKYLTKGGRIAFLIRNSNNIFNKMAGISEINNYVNTSGIKFNIHFFPGLTELEINSNYLSHSQLDVKIENNCKVIAYSKNNNPLIWTHEAYAGNILYVNSTMFQDKINRGLLLQLISFLSDNFLTTIFNAKLFNIDDFPAPIKPGQDKIIYDYYRKDNEYFYKYIWWSDLYNFKEKFNLKLTGLIIGIYNLSVKIPLENFHIKEKLDLKFLGRKLLETNGELGLHGYNHNPLAVDEDINFKKFGYKKWANEKAIRNSLIKMKHLMADLYGHINIYTYVPPSNLMNKQFINIIKDVFPNLKVVAGVYTSGSEKGELVQEFEFVNDVLYTPRISSGYIYSEEKMWQIYNGIAHIGLVNHFIHPDDLLDYNRSKNKTWKELRENIHKIFKKINDRFGFIRPMTNIEFYYEYKKYSNTGLFFEKKNNGVEIHYENFVPPIFHLYKIRNKTVKKVTGGEFYEIHRYNNSRIYFIEAKEKDVKILFND